MIKPGMLAAKTGLDVAQALAQGRLREPHAKVLIEARESLDLVLAVVTSNTAPKDGQRQVCHDLCEDQFAHVHGQRPMCGEILPASYGRGSNRDQKKCQILQVSQLVTRVGADNVGTLLVPCSKYSRASTIRSPVLPSHFSGIEPRFH